jgi:murein DD-endopeptidase MepM/ murein hydrolase activator NlpD
MIWPILGKPLPDGKAIATGGYPDARTVGTSSGAHGALDFSAPTGTPVLAIADGRVVAASAKEHLYTGRYVLLEHVFPGGLRLSGQLVRQGQQIGTVGSTGKASYSSHLHMDIRVCGAAALADYKATFGWPTTDRIPVLVSTPGCTVVPAEPLVLVDGYRSRVADAARRYGIPLVTGRSAPTEKAKGGGAVVIVLVGAVLIGSAAAAYYVWRSSRRG